MENEPMLSEIAMMAAQIYSGGEHSPKWCVRIAFQIWDETVSRMKLREEGKEKSDAQLVRK